MSGKVPNRYEALDGWRGIAALLVAVMHFPSTSHIHGFAFIKSGHLWVDFFFVLSGFVLTHAYGDRLRTADNVLRFIWRRFTRLWPLHVAVLLAFVALEVTSGVISSVFGIRQSTPAFDPAGPNSLLALFANLAMVHGVSMGRLTWNHPSWSISVEFWTAIIAAGILFLMQRRAEKIFIAVGMFALLVLTIATSIDPAQAWMNRTYDIGFFRCLVGFVAGYLAYEVHREGSWTLTGSGSEIGATAATFAFLAFAGTTAVELLAPLFFAGVVLCFADGKGAISGVLKASMFQALGRWSYAIYIVHGFLVAVLHRSTTVLEAVLHLKLKSMQVVRGERQITFDFGSPLLMDGFILLYVGLVLVLGFLAWRYIDKPSQTYLNGLILSRGPQAAGAEPARRAQVGVDDPSRGL